VRKHGLNKTTVFQLDPKGSVSVVRRSDTAESSGDIPDDGQFKVVWDSEPCHDGILWIRELYHIMNRPNWNLDQLAAWAKVWLDALRESAGIVHDAPQDTLVDGKFFDAAPFNLVTSKKGKHFIDLEWHSKEKLPMDLIAFKNLFVSFFIPRTVVNPNEKVSVKVLKLSSDILNFLGISTDAEREHLWLEKLNESNKFVFNTTINFDICEERLINVKP
jgi:hypothetical protein